MISWSKWGENTNELPALVHRSLWVCLRCAIHARSLQLITREGSPTWELLVMTPGVQGIYKYTSFSAILIWHRILLFALFHMTKAIQRKSWVSYANDWVNSTRLDSLGVPHSCKYWFIMFTVEFNICLSVWCPGSSMKQRWPNSPIRNIRVSGNKRWIDLNQSPANISSVWIIILLIFTKSNWIFYFLQSLKSVPLYYLTFYCPSIQSFVVVIKNPTCSLKSYSTMLTLKWNLKKKIDRHQNRLFY